MLEFSKNAPSENPKAQLRVLLLEIYKNLKEFQALIAKPELKSGMKKIFDKTVQKAFGEKFKQYEKVDIKKDLDALLKKNPELWLYVSGTLGLPSKNQPFSSLTNQQKLNFLALKRALQPSKLNAFLTKKEELFSAKKIIERADLHRKNQAEDLDSSFKWANLSNFGNLEKTLKADFGLTNTETLQCIAYLKFLKQNPQFIDWKNAYQTEARFAGALVLIGFGAILGALGYHFIDSIGKINPETTINNGRTQIENPENILKLLTQQAKFSNTGTLEKQMFAIDEEDNMLVQVGKKIINTGQSKKIQMEVKGNLALQYDLHSYCKMEIDHSTGVVHLTLPKPRLIVLESETKISKKSNERIQLKQFDNAEVELQKQLHQQAIDDAMQQKGFYEQAQQQTQAQLLALLKALKPHGVEIKELKIYEQEMANLPYPKG